MLFGNDTGKHGERDEEVILDGKRVSIAKLEKNAKSANRKFWTLIICSVLLLSMILPYMSLASGVAASPSDVFTGKVIPGYSMGGVEIAAYGVDLNEWGAINKDVVVQSDYGIWSGDRYKNAASSLDSAGSRNFTQLSGDESANYNLTETDKSLGWQAITGRTAYSSSHPNGVSGNSQSNQSDVVAPYRTVNDYNYWDSRTPTSNNNASADITVSLYADFVILALNEDEDSITTLQAPYESEGGTKETKQKRLYSNKNNTGTSTRANNKNKKANKAIPIYVPLSIIFDAYGIKDPDDATIDNLIDEIKGDNGRKLFEQIKDENNDLLNGTKYEAHQYENGNGAASSSVNGLDVTTSSDAFNPYPYTMVFTNETEDGEVTSSMYSNSEAYVYFSPASVYTKYMALQKEYQDILDLYSDKQIESNAAVAFQIGYYLAEMSILEAYLDEALPQDMTRGYVGPSEPTSVASANGKHTANTLADAQTSNSDKSGFKVNSSNSDPKTFASVTYSTLMYDVAHVYNNTDASNVRMGDTNAIMDTLSVFGYANTSSNVRSGVMQGMDALTTQHRFTAFTPYKSSPQENSGDQKNKETRGWDMAAGMYTPVYYPIQQHKMPESEKPYRFQILSSVPYETLIEYIKKDKFAGGVQFAYSSEDVANKRITSIQDITSVGNERSGQLAQMLQDDNNGNTGEYVFNASKYVDDMVSINAGESKSQLGNESSDGSLDGDTDKNVAKRIDAALLAYQTDSMTADNVHDLHDVVRSVRNLKYETWFRYYNPIKSEGGDRDFFLTRISPAMTIYMPSVFVNGYTAAGSGHMNSALTTTNCSFDYYSTPSFAPCFASHTSQDCYYGVLNYEQRAFYMAGFLSTLDSSTNIPALEAYNNAEEQKTEAQNEQAVDTSVMWSDIGTLWVMGKRMAAIDTANLISNGNAVVNGSDVFGINSQDGGHGSFNEYKWVSKVKIWRQDGNGGGKWDEISDSDSDKANATYAVVKADSGYENPPATMPAGTLLDGISNETFSGWIGGNNGAWLLAGKNDLYGLIDHSSPLAQSFGTRINGTDNQVILTDGNGTYIYMDRSVYFSLVYKDLLKKYFENGGKYSWGMSLDEMKSKAKDNWNKIKANVDEDDGGSVQDDEYNIYSVKFNGGVDLFKNKKIGSNEVKSDYEKKMAEATSEIQKAVSAIATENNAITDSMPSQMQNCLAWADYQNATDSENQFQKDPTETTTVSSSSSSSSSNNSNDSDGTGTSSEVLSSSDISSQTGGTYSFDASTGTIVQNNSSDDSASRQARMTRGVEGGTWTSTTQPAEYTMSATIGRIDSMSTDTGTNYPYSGLANGRMQSGTDRYALLQSHVIDYTSIASGIAGDLALVQHPKIVSISNPEYSSITDLLDIFGNLGGLLGEAGQNLLSMSSSAFASVFWHSDEKTSDITDTDTSASNGTASELLGIRNGVRTVSDASASSKTFNRETGKLVSNSGASTANAAGIGLVDSIAAPMLIRDGSSIYAMLQSFGLIIVLLSLAVIAFQNFVAYTSQRNQVEAQLNLKRVLPRALLAVFMIGLPPMNGTVGFEGGAYILLQLLSNIIAYIASIFTSLDGTGIMTMWTNIDVTSLGGDGGIATLGAYLLFFIAAVVLSALFILGMVCVILQSLILLCFYIIAPIVWGFYVWPYKSQKKNDDGDDYGIDGNGPFGKVMSTVTERLQFGPLTNGESGNHAAIGWCTGYVITAMLTIAWAIMFWLVSMVFIGSTGLSSSAASGATAAEVVASGTGSPTASAALLDGSLFMNGTSGGLPQMVFAVLIAIIMFCFMFKMMKDVASDTTFNTFVVASAMMKAIKGGAGVLANKAGNKVAGIHDDRLDRSRERIENNIQRKEAANKNAVIDKAMRKANDLHKKKVDADRKIKSELAPAAATVAKAGADVMTGKKNANDVSEAAIGTAASESAKKALGKNHRNKEALTEAKNGLEALKQASGDPKALREAWNSLSEPAQKILQKAGAVDAVENGTPKMSIAGINNAQKKLNRAENKLNDEGAKLEKAIGSMKPLANASDAFASLQKDQSEYDNKYREKDARNATDINRRKYGVKSLDAANILSDVANDQYSAITGKFDNANALSNAMIGNADMITQNMLSAAEFEKMSLSSPETYDAMMKWATTAFGDKVSDVEYESLMSRAEADPSKLDSDDRKKMLGYTVLSRFEQQKNAVISRENGLGSAKTSTNGEWYGTTRQQTMLNSLESVGASDEVMKVMSSKALAQDKVLSASEGKLGTIREQLLNLPVDSPNGSRLEVPDSITDRLRSCGSIDDMKQALDEMSRSGDKKSRYVANDLGGKFETMIAQNPSIANIDDTGTRMMSAVKANLIDGTKSFSDDVMHGVSACSSMAQLNDYVTSLGANAVTSNEILEASALQDAMSKVVSGDWMSDPDNAISRAVIDGSDDWIVGTGNGSSRFDSSVVFGNEALNDALRNSGNNVVMYAASPERYKRAASELIARNRDKKKEELENEYADRFGHEYDSSSINDIQDDVERQAAINIANEESNLDDTLNAFSREQLDIVASGIERRENGHANVDVKDAVARQYSKDIRKDEAQRDKKKEELEKIKTEHPDKKDQIRRMENGIADLERKLAMRRSKRDDVIALVTMNDE